MSSNLLFGILTRGLCLVIVFLLVNPADAKAEKVVIATYLSWYLPFGYTTACDKWPPGGWRYVGFGKYRNRPINSDSQIKLNGKSPFQYAKTDEGGAAIQKELSLLKQYGVDVLAFDMLPHPSAKYSDLFGASFCGLELMERYGSLGESLNLKVALFSDIANVSSDYPSGYYFDETQWVEAYSTVHKLFGSKSWYWKPLGKPAIFQFGATDGAISRKKGASTLHQWRKIIDDLDKRNVSLSVFLDVRPSDYTEVSKGKFLTFIFAPAAPYRFYNSFQKKLLLQSPYKVWSVNVGYYQRKFGVHLPPDFARVHYSYLNAIETHADAVLINTWNDFSEDTDVVPSVNKGEALGHLFGFYNQWFKTGVQPEIKKPLIIVAIPKYKFIQVSSRSPSWGNGSEEDEGVLQGSLAYYWVITNKEIELSINGKVISLKPGVVFGKVALDGKNLVSVRSDLLGGFDIHIDDIPEEAKDILQEGRNYLYKVLGG